MEIRAIRTEEIEQARALLAASGWSHRVSDFEQFSQLVSRSQLALVAVESGRVIGFLRALTDGIANGYVSMVAVDEAFRGRGVGTALVHTAMGENRRITWVLRAGRPGVSKFYEKLGFRVSSVAMERVREGDA